MFVALVSSDEQVENWLQKDGGGGQGARIKSDKLEEKWIGSVQAAVTKEQSLTDE